MSIDRASLRRAAAWRGPGNPTATPRFFEQVLRELEAGDVAMAELAALRQTTAPALDVAA